MSPHPNVTSKLSERAVEAQVKSPTQRSAAAYGRPCSIILTQRHPVTPQRAPIHTSPLLYCKLPMHESTTNDLSKHHEPKSTLDIIANTNNASLVEEESKGSNEGPSTDTGGPTSSIDAGDETGAAGAAYPMEVDDSKQQQDEGDMETDKKADVVMEEAEETVEKQGEAEATGMNEGDEGGAAETSGGSPEDLGDEKNKDNGSASAAESKEDGTASEPEDEKGPADVKINESGTSADAVATIEASDSQSAKANSRSMLVDSSNVGAVEEKKVDESVASDEGATGITSTEKKDGSATKSNGNTHTKPQEKSSSAAPAAAASPPPPVMKGTLSYDEDSRRHLIRGMWNYEHSTVFPPQRFELLRNLSPGEDLKMLPQDGEFHGSFSLAYFHTTSKGKQKERSKVIQESGVNIKFIKIEGKEGAYTVDGKGTNQFGIFNVNGTADMSTHEGDPTFNIVLRKRYEPSAPASTDAAPAAASTKKARPAAAASAAEADHDVGPLPPPSESFPSAVVCLRGKLDKEESNDLGITEAVQRINGMWSSGLDLVLADPENERGLCNPFEYEHKSSVTNNTFPVSGRYSGWFALKNDDGTTTRINERDVVLKFRKNNAGYHNVEGKGSNVFGKYSITGTFTSDNVITIFRHFQPRKLKNSSKAPATAAATAPGPIGAPVAVKKPSVPLMEPKLKIEDVKLPDEAASGPVEPIKPPENSTYSAVSRGVLRVNEDGSHSCQGKWAVTREHFTNGQTSNFNFRLEAHFAAEAVTAMKKDLDEPRVFPLDSPMYKGSFQLKKQGSRYQTVVDQQVVMKFHMNTQGSYNVYGTGVNAIGEFNLLGTMVMSGKTGGQVELYRMYPPERLTNPAASKSSPAASAATASSTAKPSLPVPPPALHIPSSALPGPPPPGPLSRRESTRLVKLPSRLEDDDPSAQLSRIMEKCAQILRFIREKDAELGAFFSEPVDPVALGIPTYYQIVKEPMDLKTVLRKMESEEVNSPEEFSRVVRLIFENAMSFNVDPSHSVHQAARSLLIQFNQKIRDVDRMLQNIRRAHGSDVEEKGKRGGKDMKRKRQPDEPPKSLKRRRLEEAQAMAASNASAVASIVAVASTTSSTSVSRSEFNMLLNHIQQLQQQIVKTFEAVAELSPGDETDNSGPFVPMATESSTAYVPLSHSAPAPVPEKKKPAKRKSVDAVVEELPPAVDESAPLTLDEQELLTETINELPPEHLGGVIQIIREAAPVGADEDEIDLEIDQLSYVTQRKLLRHVSKVRPRSIQLFFFWL
jgi:hypothetical protein